MAEQSISGLVQAFPDWFGRNQRLWTEITDFGQTGLKFSRGFVRFELLSDLNEFGNFSRNLPNFVTMLKTVEIWKGMRTEPCWTSSPMRNYSIVHGKILDGREFCVNILCLHDIS